MPQPAVASDAVKTFQVHLLDMGARKYGDCLLCQIGKKVILIDGGHLGDQKRSDPDYLSIPEQLEDILEQPSPWHVDLLVVTHAHSDHIGCLPNLVAAGRLTAGWALVADEELGWGEVDGVDAPVLSDAAEIVQQAFAILREEPPSFADRAEMEAFASDAVKMRTSYSAMLKKLATDGTRVVRYGKDDPAALLNAFKSTGLKILGPTREHLVACARRIADVGRDAVDMISSRLQQDASLDLASLYAELRETGGSLLGADSGDFSLGAAINDQSLVLAFKYAGRKVLLTGDMQLADAGVQGLDEAMTELRGRIAGAAPYDLVKLAHHGARNGVDTEVLAETGSGLFMISGGFGSSKHPHPETLGILEAASSIVWYRTDRNGLITVDLAKEELEVGWMRGEANDSGRNDEAEDFLSEPEPEPEPAPKVVTTRSVAVGPSGEIVEVVARIPHRRTRVVITIEVDPAEEPATLPERPERRPRNGERPSEKRADAADTAGKIRIGGGRDLPHLLFATDPDALVENIGQQEARSVCRALEESGHTVVFDNFRKMSPGKAGIQVRTVLDTQKVKGIVLVGGYNVIPPDSVDVLSADHRRAIDPRYDPDRFLVWSDDFYGDLDDDDFPEIPVSRIPDGRSARLVETALTAPLALPPRRRAGLCNLKRPFAKEIYKSIPGENALLFCDPETPASIAQEYFASDAIYLMLHGRAANARSFFGDNAAGEPVEAMDRRNLQPCPGAVVFTGCCWGSLIVDTTAWSHNQGDAFASRSPEASLALSFLASGANAFIGCTGVHYSPRLPPYNYASGPLHRAFWESFAMQGLRPAAALLEAKKSYRKGMPYPNPIPGEDPGAAAAAVEKKLLAQFTCLGLGW
jgi:beta-lactamase superfamily II metal-dependent hydrolase